MTEEKYQAYMAYLLDKATQMRLPLQAGACIKRRTAHNRRRADMRMIHMDMEQLRKQIMQSVKSHAKFADGTPAWYRNGKYHRDQTTAL